MHDMTERMAAIRARLEAATTNEAALLMLYQSAPLDLAYLLDGLQALAAKYATQGETIAAGAANVERLRDALDTILACGRCDCRDCRDLARLSLGLPLEEPAPGNAAHVSIAPLLALGRASLALEQAERACEAWRCSPAPTLAEGTATHEARERASQAYQAALSAAMKGGEG